MKAPTQAHFEHAGSVPRVAAPEVEALVCEALRREGSKVEEISNRVLVAEHLSKVIVRRDRIEFEIRNLPDQEEVGSVNNLVIRFSPMASAQKGIIGESPEDGRVAREKLLNAIRRASRWVEAVKSGEAESFEEIAAQERIGERHVRWLAFRPQIVTAILHGSAPAD